MEKKSNCQSILSTSGVGVAERSQSVHKHLKRSMPLKIEYVAHRRMLPRTVRSRRTGAEKWEGKRFSKRLNI